jgi:hypothetical protein
MRPDRLREETDWSSAPSSDVTHAVQKHRRRIGLCEEGLIVGFGATERIQEQNFTLLPWAPQPVGETKGHTLPIDGPYRFAILCQTHGTGVGPCIIGGMRDKMRDRSIIDEALYLICVLEQIE